MEAERSLVKAMRNVLGILRLPKDSMALTLNGTTHWPSRKDLQRFGEARALSTPSRIRQILQRISDALSTVGPDLRVYANEHPEFAPIGKQMLEQWEIGREASLR